MMILAAYCCKATNNATSPQGAAFSLCKSAWTYDIQAAPNIQCQYSQHRKMVAGNFHNKCSIHSFLVQPNKPNYFLNATNTWLVPPSAYNTYTIQHEDQIHSY